MPERPIDAALAHYDKNAAIYLDELKRLVRIPSVSFAGFPEVEVARSAGIPDWKIILDPGIGFGKTVVQNLELLDRVGEFRTLGFPILIGPSRKSFIGYTLNLPPDRRVEGTAAAVAISIARGVDIVRVHDVAAMARVAKMTDAIVRRKEK